jgi:hypothetical protein
MSAPPEILLAHHLKQLKLPTILREYDKVATQCAAEKIDHPRYLLRLVEMELIDRERRVVERRIREARFPAVKSLDTFDFTAIPSVNKMLVLELARCEFVLRRDNVIALGNSEPASQYSPRHFVEITRVILSDFQMAAVLDDVGGVRPPQHALLGAQDRRI